MRKQQQKELRRLEEALLEVEQAETAPDEEELDWEAFEDPEYFDSYNTDDVDVDLDEYSEDVHSGNRGGGLGVLITMLLMLVLAACVLLLLRYLGVV